jgi:ribonuclease HI
LTVWVKNWKKNGWKNSKNEPVENRDLIESILDLMDDRDVEFQHVYGHRGNEYNELADRLANEGRG